MGTAINDNAVAGVALFAWEYVCTLPAEYYVYRRLTWRAPQVVLFALNRYLTLVSVVISIYFSTYVSCSTPQRKSCAPYLRISTLIVMVPALLIFSWRTLAIWKRDRRVAIVMYVMSAVLIANTVVGMRISSTMKTSDGICVPKHPASMRIFDIYSVALSAVYDFVVISLTVYKLWWYHHLGDAEVAMASPLPTTNRARRSAGGVASYLRFQGSTTNAPLTLQLATNGLLYFVILFGFHLALLAGLIMGAQRVLVTVIPLLNPLMSVICQRIVLLEIKVVWGQRGMNSASWPDPIVGGHTATMSDNMRTQSDRITLPLCTVEEASVDTVTAPPSALRRDSTRLEPHSRPHSHYWGSQSGFSSATDAIEPSPSTTVDSKRSGTTSSTSAAHVRRGLSTPNFGNGNDSSKSYGISPPSADRELKKFNTFDERPSPPSLPESLQHIRRASSGLIRTFHRSLSRPSPSPSQRQDGEATRAESGENLSEDPALHWTTIQHLSNPVRSRTPPAPTAGQLIASMSHEARSTALRLAGLDVAPLRPVDWSVSPATSSAAPSEDARRRAG